MRNGNWMPFRFLYFIYYIFCRRGQANQPRTLAPSFWAASLLIWMIGWLIMDLLQFVNHFIDWRDPAGRLWVAWKLPGWALHPDAKAFIAITVVLTMIAYRSIFRWSYVPWLGHEFGAYDPAEPVSDSDNPAFLFSGPMFLVFGMLTIYALHHNPVIPTLIVCAIWILNEAIFRWWWRWWCHRHPERFA